MQRSILGGSTNNHSSCCVGSKCETPGPKPALQLGKKINLSTKLLQNVLFIICFLSIAVVFEQHFWIIAEYYTRKNHWSIFTPSWVNGVHKWESSTTTLIILIIIFALAAVRVGLSLSFKHSEHAHWPLLRTLYNWHQFVP